MTSIKDVARDVDMSTATVSRALRGLAGVSEETRERVMEAARRLGYVPVAERGRARHRTDPDGRGDRAARDPVVLRGRRPGGRGGPARAGLRPAALQPRRRRVGTPPGLRDQPADQARRRRPGAEPQAQPRRDGTADRPRPAGDDRRRRPARMVDGADRRRGGGVHRDPAPGRPRPPAHRLHRRRDRGRPRLHRAVSAADGLPTHPHGRRAAARPRARVGRRVHRRGRPARRPRAALVPGPPDGGLRGLGRDGHRRPARRAGARAAGARGRLGRRHRRPRDGELLRPDDGRPARPRAGSGRGDRRCWPASTAATGHRSR